MDCKNKSKPVLKIILWNASSIKDKLLEFSNFLSDYDIDIAMVTETHANASDNMTVVNYNTYKTNRTRCRGGGTAIFTKKTLNTVQYSNTERDGYEETSIIHICNNKETKYTVVYNQPGNILTQNDMDLLIPTNMNCVIGGDFNSKNTIWGARVSNKAGKVLHDLVINNDLIVHAPNEPTYYPIPAHMQPDLLDFFITTKSIKMCCDTITELSSDHIPVFASIGQEHLEQKRTIKKTNWNLFHNILVLEEISEPPNSITDIDKAINNFTNSLKSAINEASESHTINDNYQKLPYEIKDLIGYKNYVRKIWQKYRDPKDKTEYNKLVKEIKKKCQDFKTDTWNHKVENLCTSDNSIWLMTKRLKATKTINKPLVHQNKNIYSDEEKLKIFADTIERQFTLNKTPSNFDEDIITENIYNEYFNEEENKPLGILNDATLKELKTIIRKLANKKAPGEDNITNKMLKELPDNKIHELLNIYNACLKNCYFPNAWKNAIVTLFPKPGKDSSNPENHRPISLLPTLGKLLEKLILVRLEPYLQFLPDEQYGFRKQLSTTKQLIRLIDFISDGVYKKETTALLMIDVAKAFDRVYHKALIKKLIKNKLPYDIIKIIDSYLNHRTFQIRLNNKLSDKRNIQAGVPQGSLLGPVLYIIYTSDFPITKDGINYLTAFYADDTAVAVRSLDPNKAIRDLNSKMCDIEDWCADNKIAINTDKSKLLIIRKHKTRKPINECLSLFNRVIPTTNDADYLGLSLNTRLSWNTHINKVINKTKAAFMAMLPILNNKSKLSLTLKRQLYIQCLRPIMTYACPAWHTINKTQIKKMETTQNKILRYISGAPRYLPNRCLRKDLKISTIEEYIKQITASFFGKAEQETAANFNHILEKEYIEDMRSHNPIVNFYLSDSTLSKFYR